MVSLTYIFKEEEYNRDAKIALIVADIPDFDLPKGYNLGFPDPQNQRTLYGRYYTKRGGYLIINEIDEQCNLIENYDLLTELENHLVTTDLFENIANNPAYACSLINEEYKYIGFEYFSVHVTMDRNHVNSHAETDYWVETAFIEGDMKHEIKLYDTFFADAGLDTTPGYVSLSSELPRVLLNSDIKPEYKDKIAVIQSALNWITNLASKDVHRSLFLFRFPNSKDFYSLFSRKYTDKETGKTIEYSNSYYEELFEKLGFDENDLKDIACYTIEDDNSITVNSMDKKKFYSKFLEKITQNMPDFAEVYGLVGEYASFEDTTYFKKDSKDEEILRKLDAALDKLMGFSGLLMLKTGLLTISEMNGVYKCENNVPDWESLNKILRNQKILAQSYGQSDRDFYGKSTLWTFFRLKDSGAYSGRFYVYLSLFLTGSRESITFKSEDGDEAKVVLDNYPDYDLHRNIFAGIDFSRDILTIKDNLQMVRLLLDNKLLDFAKWTTEKRNELVKEQLMEMFFESGNYATKLLFKLVGSSEDDLIKPRKDGIMEAISTSMATLHKDRVINYKAEDSVRGSLEDLIADKGVKSGDIYVWMKIDGKWKPVPIFVDKEFLFALRTPKVRDFKSNSIRWGVSQTKDFDPYMEKKIDDLYDRCPKNIKYFKDDTEDKRYRKKKFIEWLIEENQFYLYGKYLEYITEKLQKEKPKE